MLNKIGLIGGGYIGGVLTQEIAQRRLAREVGLSDPAPFVNPDDPPERQEVSAKQSVAKAPRGRSQAQVSAQHRADRNR